MLNLWNKTRRKSMTSNDGRNASNSSNSYHMNDMSDALDYGRSSHDLDQPGMSDVRASSGSFLAKFMVPKRNSSGQLYKSSLPEEERKLQLQRNNIYQKSKQASHDQNMRLLRNLKKGGHSALRRICDPHARDSAFDVTQFCLRHGIILDEMCPSNSRLATEEEMKAEKDKFINMQMALACNNCGKKTVCLQMATKTYVCLSCGCDHGVMTVSLAYAANKPEEDGKVSARGDVVHAQNGDRHTPATSQQEARNLQEQHLQIAQFTVPSDLRSMQRSLERRALNNAIELADPLTIRLKDCNKHARGVCEQQYFQKHIVGEPCINALLNLIDADLRRLCQHQDLCTEDRCEMRMSELSPQRLKIVVNVVILDWLEVFAKAMELRQRLHNKMSASSLSMLIPNIEHRHYMTDSHIPFTNFGLTANKIHTISKGVVNAQFNASAISTINLNYKNRIMTVLIKLRKKNPPACCCDKADHDLLKCSYAQLMNASVDELQETRTIADELTSQKQQECEQLEADYEYHKQGYSRLKQCINELVAKHHQSDELQRLVDESTKIMQTADRLQRKLNMHQGDCARYRERVKQIDTILWKQGKLDTKKYIGQSNDDEKVADKIFTILDTGLESGELEHATMDKELPSSSSDQHNSDMLPYFFFKPRPSAPSVHASNPCIASTASTSTGSTSTQTRFATETTETNSRSTSACSQDSAAMMPPPAPISSNLGGIYHCSPKKRSRSISNQASSSASSSASGSVEQRPLTAEGLQLQSSLSSVRAELVQAPNTHTHSAAHLLMQYRDPAADTSSLASSDNINYAIPMARVASASSVASSTESYTTALSTLPGYASNPSNPPSLSCVSTIPKATLLMPSEDMEKKITSKLLELVQRNSGNINRVSRLADMNRKHKVYSKFRSSDDAKAFYNALLSKKDIRLNETTLNAAYIFMGIVYAFKHGFLHDKPTPQSNMDILSSPSKRNKIEREAIDMSYDEAYEKASKCPEVLKDLSTIITSGDIKLFKKVASACNLLTS